MTNQDLTGVTQLGTPIMQWFKSTKHNAQDVINDFTAEDLANAVAVTPINSGIEGNLNYVEFQVSSFSTFGYLVTNNNFALPITFNSFTGINNGCTNDLTWVVDAKDAALFDVQWSSDGRQFETIATLNANHNSLYQYQHATDKKNNYYRILSKEVNGTIAYSHVIELFSSCDNKLSLYPNPTNGKLYIKGSHGVVSVKVINTLGQVVLTNTLTDNQIDLEQLAGGYYVIQLLDENAHVIHNEKIMKQ